MNYMYGVLRNIDTTLNKVVVGSFVFRTTPRLARDVQARNLVGKYVQVRFSFGQTIDRASEVKEMEGHGTREETRNDMSALWA